MRFENKAELRASVSAGTWTDNNSGQIWIVHASLSTLIGSGASRSHNFELRDPDANTTIIGTFRLERSALTDGNEIVEGGFAFPVPPGWGWRNVNVEGASQSHRYFRSFGTPVKNGIAPIWDISRRDVPSNPITPPNNHRPTWVTAIRELVVGGGGGVTTTINIRDPANTDYEVARWRHSRSALQSGTNTYRITVSFVVPAGWTYNISGGSNVTNALTEIKI